jgi:hypothetical protein
MNEFQIKQNLDSHDQDWVKKVYEQTCVLFYWNHDEFELWTTNGWFSLDEMIDDYENESSVQNPDLYKTVEDIVRLIKSLPGYEKKLLDSNVNGISKSELFVNVVYNIWEPTLYATAEKYKEKSEHLNFKRIVFEKNGVYYNLEQRKNITESLLTIEVDFVERDESYVSIPLSRHYNFEETMDYIVKELSLNSDPEYNDYSINIYVHRSNKKVLIPKTFEEMKEFVSKIHELRDF